jgi:hypothetical protein
MSKWFYRILANPDDYGLLTDAIAYFNNELDEATEEVKLCGVLVSSASKLPGKVEYRYAQYQEALAIYKFFEMKKEKAKNSAYINLQNSYKRALSARELEKFSDNDDEVIAISTILLDIDLVCNKYAGIMKAFDIQNWQISNITKLKVAGFEDLEID